VQRKADGRSILFAETPKTIRLRQFTEISKAQGYKSEVEFAQAVVSGNTTERLHMLMEYYRKKEYPNESIESYSQTIQSSQELNSGKDKESATKKKGPVNHTRHCRKSSTKSFTKVLKASVVKPNKSNRLAKKRSTYLKTKAESKESESGTVSETDEQHKTDGLESFESSKFKDKSALLLRNNANQSFSDIADNLEHKKTRRKSVSSGQVEAKAGMSPKGSEDKLLGVTTDYDESKSVDKGVVGAASCVAPINTENACEDILNDILTACSETNTRYSQPGPSRDIERTSDTPPLSNSESSSFLDEFLFECSQKTRNRTQDSLSQYGSPSNERKCVKKTNNCQKMQTSIIDDLI
jgi:hypothetical protein